MARVIRTIYACPNGIYRMSDSMENLVETSSNLAIVKSENGVIKACALLRSSVDSAKEDFAEMMASVVELAGGNIEFAGGYPGWKPNMESPILNTMQTTYQKMFGRTPKVMAIHAGLECGLLGGVYKNWDMISFGPTIQNPHSPDERVNIPSVKLFWDYLVETLKNVPQK
jgi:dipeptidase D